MNYGSQSFTLPYIHTFNHNFIVLETECDFLPLDFWAYPWEFLRPKVIGNDTIRDLICACAVELSLLCFYYPLKEYVLENLLN